MLYRALRQRPKERLPRQREAQYAWIVTDR